MRIIIAMDSFKGSLSSLQACEAVEEGLRRVLTAAEVEIHPLADGGEGTAASILAALPGEWVPRRVMGPLPDRQVEAGYAWLEGSLALVEMAAASGLTLLERSALDPLRTTTYGTGELVQAALDSQPERLYLAAGGSATIDGGVGAAKALGWRFLDAVGTEVGLGGGELARIHAIQPPEDVAYPPIEVLCDVEHPMCGMRGAARVFGPQKGASPEEVEILDSNLEHLCNVISRETGHEIGHLPFSGAAGGLAGGAVAFLGANLISGIDAIMKMTSLKRRLKSATWVITGEGRLDRQSLDGKVVSGVSRLAHENKVRIAILAGSIGLSASDLAEAGISAAESATSDTISLEDALRQAGPLLSDAAERLARRHLSFS